MIGVDLRIHDEKMKKIYIKDIIESIGCINFIGEPNAPIIELIKLDESNNRADVLSWCSDKNSDKLCNVKAGTIICSSAALKKQLNSQVNWIIVDNPRLYFSRVVEQFFYQPPVRKGISKTAYIHQSSQIGTNCYIGEYVVIEENCLIGNNCEIGHHTVIHHGTSINDNVKIGCSNTIGGFGYGYEKDEQGQYLPIPHLGNVIINEQVEICNNSCIDRAALGSTTIGINVKISNLVHIGHGVTIGKNSLIIANAMIAGSTTIGENVWVSPSTSIINNTTIKNNAVLGLGAVVLKPVEENAVVVGNPARDIHQLNKSQD